MLCAFIPHNDMVQISLIPFYRWENQDLEIKKHTKLIDDSARIEKEALWSQNPHFQPPIKTLNYTKWVRGLSLQKSMGQKTDQLSN